MSCAIQHTACQALAKPKTDRSCIFSHSLKPPTLQRRYRQSHRLAAQDSQADTDPPRNPLFANNPQFAAAFSHVVTRQGDEAVYSGAQAAKPAERTSPHEDMLLTSLQTSRRNILQYQAMEKTIGNAIKAEEAQFERLHFAYKKIKAEGAYIKQLERRLAEEKAKNQSR